jgi:hypothetical protein
MKLNDTSIVERMRSSINISGPPTWRAKGKKHTGRSVDQILDQTIHLWNPSP